MWNKEGKNIKNCIQKCEEISESGFLPYNQEVTEKGEVIKKKKKKRDKDKDPLRSQKAASNLLYSACYMWNERTPCLSAYKQNNELCPEDEYNHFQLVIVS